MAGSSCALCTSVIDSSAIVSRTVISRSPATGELLDYLVGTLLNSLYALLIHSSLVYGELNHSKHRPESFSTFTSPSWTGVIHVQTYTFYRNFPRDPSYIKAIVATLWAAQTFFFFSCMFLLYHALIRTMKYPSLIYTIPWEIRLFATHKLITTTLSQFFFAYRLWTYGRDVYRIFPLGVLVLANLGNAYDKWHATSALYDWLQTAWNVAIVAADLYISTYLSFLMLKRRSGFRSTETIMNMVIIYGVTTGAISSVLAIVLLLSNQLEQWTIEINVATWAPAVVICAVLANLHLRTALREHVKPDESIPTPSFSLRVLDRASRSTHPTAYTSTATQPPSHDNPPLGLPNPATTDLDAREGKAHNTATPEDASYPPSGSWYTQPLDPSSSQSAPKKDPYRPSEDASENQAIQPRDPASLNDLPLVPKIQL